MKKLLLSASVVGLFFFYGLFKRDMALSAKPAVPQDTGNVQPIPQAAVTPKILPQPTTVPGAAPAPAARTAAPAASQGRYKDGTYTGNTIDAFYGFVQVQVTISGGRITDVRFLKYPNDRSTSVAINSQAMPYLRQEAIQAQSANVNIVSGASATSQGFRLSLDSALRQAH